MWIILEPKYWDSIGEILEANFFEDLFLEVFTTKENKLHKHIVYLQAFFPIINRKKHVGGGKLLHIKNMG